MNSSKYRTYLKDQKLRAYLQEAFILDYLFPWMDAHNGRFPRIKDFGESPNKIPFSAYRLFHPRVKGVEYWGLFDSRYDLVSKAIAKAKEKGLYYFYSFPSVKISTDLEDNPHVQYITSVTQEDLLDPKKREEIQRYFIENIIFPWALSHNGTFPEIPNYSKGSLGITYSKVFGVKKPSNNRSRIIGIFDSMNDLKYKVALLDQERQFISIFDKTNSIINEHTRYIYSSSQEDLKDPQKREHFQQYFIENMLFPWILNHNGAYPKISDFKKNAIGISFVKLFGFHSEGMIPYIGIFNTPMDLRNKAFELSKNYPSISIRSTLTDKLLFSANLHDLDFNNPEDVYRYKVKFINAFILPWIDIHQKFPTRDNFGIHQTQVGISYGRIFGLKYNNKVKYPALFESLNDLKIFMLLLMEQSKIPPIYQRYVNPCYDKFLQ